MNAPIPITGIGCVGAPGSGIPAQLAALEAGRRHLVRGPRAGFPLAAGMHLGWVDAALPSLPRTAALAAVAAEEAVGDLPRAARRDTGVVVGSATAGMPESEAIYLERGDGIVDDAYRLQQTHHVGALVARRLGCRGPRSSHSVACASSACAMAEAASWIREGRCQRVLVIGVDANTRLTMAGFASLRVVDPGGCRPMVADRAGMSLGEGAGALLLELPDAAAGRGAFVHAELRGWGLRNDAHHPTAPHPEGRWLARAIRDALADCDTDPGDVGYVNVHGTGTRDNDAAEAAAVAETFGRIPVASSKGIYGHTMGAASAVEAVAVVLALREGRLFANSAGHGDPLEAVDVVGATRAAPGLRCALSTSLAFGGVNAALCFGAVR